MLFPAFLNGARAVAAHTYVDIEQRNLQILLTVLNQNKVLTCVCNVYPIIPVAAYTYMFFFALLVCGQTRSTYYPPMWWIYYIYYKQEIQLVLHQLQVEMLSLTSKRGTETDAEKQALVTGTPPPPYVPAFYHATRLAHRT